MHLLGAFPQLRACFTEGLPDAAPKRGASETGGRGQLRAFERISGLLTAYFKTSAIMPV
jgi:hypothetical protein